MRACHICSSGLLNRMRNWTLDSPTSSVPQLHLFYLEGKEDTCTLSDRPEEEEVYHVDRHTN